MQKHEKFGGRVAEQGDQPCGWPDCGDAGEFRAPKSMTESASANGIDPDAGDSLWFCLDHVREYNTEWDFFAGRSAAEIDQFRRRDSTWHRPTWPFGGASARGSVSFDARPIDALNIFGNDGAWSPADTDRGFNRPLNGKDQQALLVLGLDRAVGASDIKARFKALVKELHPDGNDGDRSSEDRLRDVIDAYNHLSEAFAT